MRTFSSVIVRKQKWKSDHGTTYVTRVWILNKSAVIYGGHSLKHQRLSRSLSTALVPTSNALLICNPFTPRSDSNHGRSLNAVSHYFSFSFCRRVDKLDVLRFSQHSFCGAAGREPEVQTGGGIWSRDIPPIASQQIATMGKNCKVSKLSLMCMCLVLVSVATFVVWIVVIIGDSKDVTAAWDR